MSNDAGAGRQAHLRRIALGQRLGRLASGYFLVLALLSLGGCVAAQAAAQHFRPDWTWLLFLALGLGLRRFRNWVRITALILCGLVIFGALAMFALALIDGTQFTELTVFRCTYEDPSLNLVVLIASVGVTVFAVPFGLLLHPAVRRAFRATARSRKRRLLLTAGP